MKSTASPRIGPSGPLLAFILWLGLTAPAGAQQGAATGAAPAETSSGGPRTLLATPAGDTIADLRSGAAVEIVAREGEWVRARVEGWMSAGAVDQARDRSAETAIGLAALRAEPDRYIGQTVRWRVQHIGVQRADSLRSDMPRGAPYMLARDPGGEAGLVYATVPAHLLDAASTLSPLQRVVIVGRVVTGRSPLTGHPILELLEIQP